MQEINRQYFKNRYSKDYKTILYILLSTVGVILTIDFIGLVAWTLSGQFPPDNIFVGRITLELLRLIQIYG